MNFDIRKYSPCNREELLQMMKEFFASPAVLHNVPEKHFEKTLQELENEKAARLYKKLGFEELGYNQFTQDK